MDVLNCDPMSFDKKCELEFILISMVNMLPLSAICSN